MTDPQNTSDVEAKSTASRVARNYIIRKRFQLILELYRKSQNLNLKSH